MLLKSGKKSSAAIQQFYLNDFSHSTLLGVGGQARVERASYGSAYVAIKIYNDRTSKDNQKEVSILLKHSNHPNIIQPIGTLLDEDSNCVGYVMEYMGGGSLSRIIHNYRISYDMRQICSWIEKIARGLEYLHAEGLLHRDINPKNILIGSSMDDVKIADFGTVRTAASITSNAGAGTYVYMAPEVFKKKKYGTPADVYSFSLTIWEIIHRRYPFEQLTSSSLSDLITAIVRGERPAVEKDTPSGIRSLLTKGWHQSAEKRPKIKDFIEFARKARKEPEKNPLIAAIRRSIRASKRVKTSKQKIENVPKDDGETPYDQITMVNRPAAFKSPFFRGLFGDRVPAYRDVPTATSTWDRQSGRLRISGRMSKRNKVRYGVRASKVYQEKQESPLKTDWDSEETRRDSLGQEADSPRRLNRKHSFYMG